MTDINLNTEIENDVNSNVLDSYLSTHDDGDASEADYLNQEDSSYAFSDDEVQETKNTNDSPADGGGNVDDIDDADPAEKEDEKEFVIEFNGKSLASEEEKNVTPAMKELRKEFHRLQLKNKELEQKIQQSGNVSTSQTAVPAVPSKPTLDSCDGDIDRFEFELADWYDRRKAREHEEQRLAQEKKRAEEAFKQKLTGYQKLKTELPVKDFDECELTVAKDLTDIQQGIIVKYASNPALLVYGLGKSKDKLKELSALKDPAEFAVAVGRFEAHLRITSKRKVPNDLPPPEGTIRASSTRSPSIASAGLDRLVAQAQKSGDITALAKLYQRPK